MSCSTSLPLIFPLVLPCTHVSIPLTPIPFFRCRHYSHISPNSRVHCLFPPSLCRYFLSWVDIPHIRPLFSSFFHPFSLYFCHFPSHRRPVLLDTSLYAHTFIFVPSLRNPSPLLLSTELLYVQFIILNCVFMFGL
ncbi:hypothetical protein BJ165DRAFT_1519248 [Panaeolus papilionaceus]|nr:hypothetical protein BJ165DRAFT_1519248 [Panaeolus papilionaceus]